MKPSLKHGRISEEGVKKIDSRAGTGERARETTVPYRGRSAPFSPFCRGDTFRFERSKFRKRAPKKRFARPGPENAPARRPFRTAFGPFCRGDTFRFWTCKNFKVDTRSPSRGRETGTGDPGKRKTLGVNAQALRSPSLRRGDTFRLGRSQALRRILPSPYASRRAGERSSRKA